jgi:hypothetical protein
LTGLQWCRTARFIKNTLSKYFPPDALCGNFVSCLPSKPLLPHAQTRARNSKAAASPRISANPARPASKARAASSPVPICASATPSPTTCAHRHTPRCRVAQTRPAPHGS